MPLTKWCVEPVFLSRKPIPPDKTRINELECNNNNTLVGVLRQLASLVKISDKIFSDLSEECCQLLERTMSLKFKVDRCESLINQLNAKSVKVPVGNLNAFIQIETHFKSNRELSNNLFTTNTRPQCIKDSYLAASLTPLHIIRAIDSCRDDGRCGSKLFICQPVFADSKKKVNFDIETRRPASLVFAHELPRNVIIERAKTPLCNSHHVILNKEVDNCEADTTRGITNDNNTDNRSTNANLSDADLQQNPLYGLISPEERMQVISQEYPSKYVPIDVSGVGFSRMSNLRRSLIHADFLIKRKKSNASKGKRVKRRNTICQSANELSVNGNNENRRNRVRRRSAGSIDFVHTSCQTEVNENEIYSTGRIVEVKKCKNKSTHALNNNNNNNNNSTYDNYNRENKIKLKAEVHHYESRSLDNLIDCNHKHESVGPDMPQMIDSSEVESNQTNNNEMTEKCKNQNSLPISSLSVAINAAVKMRDNLAAKGVGDDGRSSSGNWSASSSTHASVDSDHIVNGGQSLKNDLPHTLSNSSLGKDSAISDSNTTPNENDGRLSAQETNSYSSEASHFNNTKSNTIKFQTEPKTLESSVNDSVVIRANNSESGNKVQYANRDSESWLQYYDSSDTITPTPTESESGQTNQAITSSCGNSRRSSFSAIGRQSNDDEAESVYSVDNDGYYTSMHTDSGLFRVPVKLMITPNSSFRLKGKRDSITSVCTVGDISINSILSKTETESSTTTLTNNSYSSGRVKLPPPPPPPRVSSMLRSIRNSTISNKTIDSCSDNGTIASNTSTSSRSHSPSPAATITSESEQSEVARLRFKAKTNFDSSSYPSMCAITSNENSDDGKSADSYSSDGSNRVTPTGKMMKSRAGSYKGFRIKDIFGFGHSSKDDRSSPLTVPAVPHIATIRRPQSPLRFNMYNGEGSHRFRRFAEKINGNSTTNQYQTPNIIRANAISSFASDSNESANEPNSVFKSSSAITTANTDKKSETSDVSDTHLIASNSVPNPSPNCNSNLSCNSDPKPSSVNEIVSEVPHSMLYPISRQVSIPIPRNHWKPLTLTKPTTTSSISRPVTLATPASNANRSVARVTLDANGCVIYASNSLGRRRDGHPMNYLNQIQKTPAKIQEEQRCATLPKAHKPSISSPLSPPSKPGALVHMNSNGYAECSNGANRNTRMQPTQPTSSPDKTSDGRSHTRTSMSNKSHSPDSAPASRCVTPVVNKQKARPTTPANGLNSQNIFGNSSKEGTDRKSPASVSFSDISNKKHLMESDLSDFVPSSTSSRRDNSNDDSQSSAESSTDSSKAEATSTIQRRGRLTTEDLLIIIHNSKKKHNIKTEPEIIIPNSPPSTRSQSSNSSNSPGSTTQQVVSRPNTPSRITQQFNGLNTPINGNSDRRSWNGSEISPNNSFNQAGNRRSLASDRLGSTRPTTMNDFKRLLSQTRSSTFNTDRLSAAEILRANSKRPLTPVINCITSFVSNNKTKSTPTSSTTSRISPSVTCTPPPQISNGSISINTPNIIKPRIINGRSTRSSYRLENICPPILEDCSEETDDKKCANAAKQRLHASKVYNPVINNYNKVAANPQSTSTWV